MEDKKAAYDKEFREGVVNYQREHPDETFVSIGKKFGVHSTTVGKWYRDAETRGEVVVRGSGNYESDEAKEIAHLRKELRDYKDAVEVLKKAIGILGKQPIRTSMKLSLTQKAESQAASRLPVCQQYLVLAGLTTITT